MEKDLEDKLVLQETKLDAIYKSVEKTRRYFLTIVWISILMVVIPILGLIFAIPKFLDTYSSLDGLL